MFCLRAGSGPKYIHWVGRDLLKVGPAPERQVSQKTHVVRGNVHRERTTSSYTPVKDRRLKRPILGVMIFSLLSVLFVAVVSFFFLADGAMLSLKLKEYFNSEDRVEAVVQSPSQEEPPEPTGKGSTETLGIDELEAARSRFLSLDFSSRIRIQKWLALNFEYQSTIDGLWGPSTAASMRKVLRRLPNAQTAYTVALMEIPPSVQTTQPIATPQPTNPEAVSRERYIAQLWLACSISPAGTLGERLADSQLFAATGQRCAKPTPAAPTIPTMPGVTPNQRSGMNCEFRSKPQLYRIPGMYYPPTLECW